MPRVKPEVLYAPLAPLIVDARARGLSDDEILERLEVAKSKAREAGYTGGEIMEIHSPEVVEESKPKSMLRGLVEGLTLGMYVPESLKQQPNEIESGTTVPGTGFEVYPGPAGEFAGSVVPFTGALKATRPIAQGLARRVLGTGRAGAVGAESANVGLASGAVEGIHSGGDVESTALATGMGAGLGGALGVARQILAARRRAKPSEVVENPPEPIPEMEIAAPPPAAITPKRPFQESPSVVPGRGIPRETDMLVRRPVEEPPRPLPTAKDKAMRRAGLDPTQPAERPGRVLDPSGKPVLLDRQGKPIVEGADPVDMEAIRKVAAEAEAAAAKVRATKKPPEEPPPSTATPPDAPPLTTAPGGVRLVAKLGDKTWKYQRGSQAEAEALQESIKATVDPAVARRMTFAIEATGKKAKATPKIEVPASPEVPSGLSPKAPKGEPVTLPEETQTVSIADLLDRKGLVFRVDRGVKDRPYVVVGEGGDVKRFKRLHDVIGFADTLADDVRASTVAKGIRGGELSAAETKALKGMRGRRKVANQPVSVEDNPQFNAGPPLPGPVPPPMMVDPMTGMPTIGGPGAQLALPQWVQHVARSKAMPEKEATRFGNAVTELSLADPMMEAEIRAAFDKPRMVSWNPFDLVGQPQGIRNRLVNKAARETTDVEMAWDFEAKKWDEYFVKHFQHLSEKEAEQTARLIEGELKPGSVSERVQQAAAAWKTAAEDFAKRLGVPEWAEYLTRLTDMDGVYAQWRPHMLAAKRFEDLSETLQFKLGSESVFNTMRRAMEKQEKWDNLPQDVRGWFKERLLNWFDGAQWDSLPEHVKSRVPKEVFDRFLLPRTGGLPYTRDVRKSFQAYVPVALKKLHVDPLLERWQPIANHLPGSQSHPLSEGYYLRKYLTRFEGKESVGLDKVVDSVVRSVEDTLGKSLADPNVLSRISGRAAAWTYRGTLGLDSAIVNMTQPINNWAASGSTPFLRGLGRFIAGESPARPEVGLLKEFRDIYAKGEFLTRREMARTEAPSRMQRLADLDDKITQITLSPMGVTEFTNRGVAFATGMEEAAALGLNASQAIQMGFARASKVVPNLELTRAQMQALMRVEQTQFGFSPAFRSPYLAGPLARLSTIFWTFPTRQSQFLSNGVADGLQSVLRQPSFDNVSRLTRFAALTGLFVTGASLGAKIGLNVERLFGSPSDPLGGLFPSGFAGPIGLLTQMYSLARDGKPMTQRDIDQAWKNAANFLIPQYRWATRGFIGERSALQAAQRGYQVDDLGRQTYRTTPYGEFMRAIGFEYGQSYRERVAVRTILEDNARRLDHRRSALDAALRGDFGPATKYNERYPELPLRENDLQAEMKLRQRPLIERTGPMFMRRRALDEIEDTSGESTGARP